MEYELIDFFSDDVCMLGSEELIRNMYNELTKEGCLVLIRFGNNIVESPFGKSFDRNKTT